jgi:protein TonB
MAASIAAPIATPSSRSKSLEWEEQRSRPAPQPKLQPRWQEEKQSQSQSQSSPIGKWIAIAAVAIVVTGVPAGYFLTKHQHAIPVADAATADSSSSAVSESMPEPSSVHASVAAISQISVKPVVAAPIAAKNVAPAPEPKHQAHEAKAAVVAPAPTPAPAPIMLAANVPKAPRTVDLDSVVPVKMPTTVAEPAAVSQIPLPSSSGSTPKLAAPIPDVRSGGSLIKRVNPIYPQLAKSAGIQGAVELQLHIAPDGTVDKVRRVSGQPMLANAAIEAVKQWRYDPAKLNGKPVEMETTVRLNFDLSGRQ